MSFHDKYCHDKQDKSLVFLRKNTEINVVTDCYLLLLMLDLIYLDGLAGEFMNKFAILTSGIFFNGNP